MKIILPFLLSLICLSAGAQSVNISGRCYYDVNGNYVFDGTDSVLANRLVFFQNYGGVYNAITDAAGQYTLSVPVDTFQVHMSGAFDFRNYKDTASQRRIYTVPGSDVVNFAYQKRDSIEQVNAGFGFVSFAVPPSGGTRQYKLEYSYDGLLQNIPASIKLWHSSKLSLVSSSFPPSVTGSGFLQWNFASIQRNVFDERPKDSILLTFSFPATGDTIGSFIFEPKFVPVVAVTKPYRKYNFNYEQEITRSAPSPIGPTNGVKWLRQYPVVYNFAFDYCTSVDTAMNGSGYFVTGQRTVEPINTSGVRFSYIAKLNPDGLSVWEKYIDTLPGGTNILEIVNAVKHTSDGGCIVLGNTRDINYLSSYDPVVLRLNASGDIVWIKQMQGSGYEGVSNNLEVLPDGSSIIAGNTDSKDGDFVTNTDSLYGNLFVTKFSPGGNILFTKIYGGSKGEYANRIVALQNGTFLVLASTASNDGDVTGAHQHFTISPNGEDTVWSEEAWVLNINASGGIIWNRCYGGRKDSYLSGAAENAGGILLTGYTNSKDGDLPYYQEMSVPLWALQISNTGNIVWSKLHKLYKGYQDTNYVIPPYETYYNAATTRLCKTKDGNFVTGVSTADKYGTIKTRHGYEDMAVVKLNTAGDIVWQKAIGGSLSEYLYEIQVDRNDDVLFGGSSNSPDDDLYLQTVVNTNFYKESMVVGKLGITNNIKGQVFVDNNGNHIKDGGEMYYSQGRVTSIKNTDTITARIFGGQFLNNVDTGNYVTTYKPANNYYTVFPASRSSSFSNFDLKDSFDFALAPKPNINDLEVQLLPLSTPRPGFDVTYRVITKNVGTTTINNVVLGFENDSRMTYNFASRPENGIAADSVWWGPFTLSAFDIDTLFINYTLDAPPVLNNGDTITNTVTANPVINDSSAVNNMASLREIVRGSFDPNDKTEVHGGTLTTTQYAGGEYLQYLIRFQNTGTDTAFFITVKDTLQQKFDLSTLEIVSASHPFVFRLNGNIATWDFKKINLPDSTTDEPNSHGFILFRVKPKTGLTVGDEFTNNAAIYFDFNLPVITNQEKTTIGSNNGVCPGGNVSFTAGITGATYQWQVNTGGGYTNLSNGGIYSGVNTAVLQLTGAPTSLYGYRYRCVVNGSTNSPENVLRFAVQWTGAAGTAWESAANWDCNTLPDAKTEVIIPAGSNYPQVNSNRSCYSLRLSAGSTVTVKTGFTLTITGRAN